jgi:hypothetical protein
MTTDNDDIKRGSSSSDTKEEGEEEGKTKACSTDQSASKIQSVVISFVHILSPFYSPPPPTIAGGLLYRVPLKIHNTRTLLFFINFYHSFLNLLLLSHCL